MPTPIVALSTQTCYVIALAASLLVPIHCVYAHPFLQLDWMHGRLMSAAHIHEHVLECVFVTREKALARPTCTPHSQQNTSPFNSIILDIAAHGNLPSSE